MLSLLQPSIYLTLLAVLHHPLLPFLPTALWKTQLPSHLAWRTLSLEKAVIPAVLPPPGLRRSSRIRRRPARFEHYDTEL